jgi:hypothetical protein
MTGLARRVRFDWRRFLPRYWSQNDRTDYEWDGLLNDLLDIEQPLKISDHYCKIGDFKIWISNWPYAYGNLEGSDCLPSVSTRIRLKRELESQRFPEVHAFIRNVIRQGR